MTPRYKLCTLLIVLALGPPVLAGAWWAYESWRQPAISWEEATKLAGMVQSGGGTFTVEDKPALRPPPE